jgi:uncharacterized protein YdeI (YjbR/CyaY-like superfamily)
LVSEREAVFFDTPGDFRAWLEANHERAGEIWVGYWKKTSNRRGIAYGESVDEALCFGWIDGLTRRIDEDGYATRFTPRRASSNWSQANIRRVGELRAAGRMTEAGWRAFEKRRVPAPDAYTYETRPPDLPDPYAEVFRRDEDAWRFWSAQRASYRKSMTWWVLGAIREDTRIRRLEALIAESAARRVIDELHLPKLRPPARPSR